MSTNHRRLSVGVIVDLFRGLTAGGHVKCWERLAEAAKGTDVDLTVYFLGERRAVVPVAENVRYVMLAPLLSTNSFQFLDNIPAHTDLAPIHPGVLGYLRRHHVIHTTDAFFSLARTAQYYARLAGRALVNSIHTDTPGYTRIYSAQILRRLFGDGFCGRMIRDRWHCEERLGARMQRKLDRYLRRCDWAMASQQGDLDRVESTMARGRSSLLRRGIDKETFHPRKRDRKRFAAEFGIQEDRSVLLCVGRVDPGKNVMTLARAARILIDRGAPVHVVFAGDGSQTGEIQQLLSNRVTLLGTVPQAELAWIYASSDLFVFPSQVEVSPNAVVEAKASGLPSIVSASGGSANFIHPPPAKNEDGLLVEGTDSWVWSEAIDTLLRDPQRRVAMAEQARRAIETKWPSWRDVLLEDLMPIWLRVARERGAWA